MSIMTPPLNRKRQGALTLILVNLAIVFLNRMLVNVSRMIKILATNYYKVNS